MRGIVICKNSESQLRYNKGRTCLGIMKCSHTQNIRASSETLNVLDTESRHRENVCLPIIVVVCVGTPSPASRASLICLIVKILGSLNFCRRLAAMNSSHG